MIWWCELVRWWRVRIWWTGGRVHCELFCLQTDLVYLGMFDESPGKLVQESIEGFEIEGDLYSINRIERSIAETKLLRTGAIETHENRIKQLEHQHETLLNEVRLLTKVSGINRDTLNLLGTEKLPDNSEDNIFAAMNRKSYELDKLKLTFAKTLNDLESQLNSMRIQKSSLDHSHTKLLQEMDDIVSENVMNNPDSRVMKLNIYKSLGVSIEQSGAGDKIFLYNKETDVSSVLDVSDKYSDYFITNHIWDRL